MFLVCSFRNLRQRLDLLNWLSFSLIFSVSVGFFVVVVGFFFFSILLSLCLCVLSLFYFLGEFLVFISKISTEYLFPQSYFNFQDLFLICSF